MGAGPAQVIPAPLAAPPRVGLVASAAKNPPGVPDRWQNGFNFEPEKCATGGLFDPCDTSTLTIAAGQGVVTFQPFGIWAGEKCSAHGFAGRDYQGRATRTLAAVQSKLIEHEFWTGDFADSAGADFSDNGRLADPASDDLTGTGSALSTVNALACLEQYLAECNGGQRGMIHASRQLVSLWHQGGALRKEGALVLTINDTIVVPGAGYDGSGPNGQNRAAGAQFAYATDEVSLLISAPQVNPSNFSDAMDRTLNTIEFRAYQAVGIIWPHCCHATVRVDAPLCGVGGGS